MANVLLISENKLKAFTTVNKSVDIDAIRSEILVSQDVHLQNLLGTKFYNSLLSKVSATGNTFTNDELTLVQDFIAPYLIHISYYEMLPALHLRTMNVGVVQPGALEGGRQGVDIATMQYLRGLQKQRSDFYQQRLVDYLNTGYGQGLFPDYLNYSTLDGMVPDKTAKYNSPIYTNRTTRYGYGYDAIRRSMPSYSEIESSNPPCRDCY